MVACHRGKLNFQKRLCRTLDNENALDKIRTEISAILTNSYDEGVKEKALQIIDKYKAERERIRNDSNVGL